MTDEAKRMHYGVTDATKCQGWDFWFMRVGRNEIVMDDTPYQSYFIRVGPQSWGLQLSLTYQTE